MGDNIHHLTSLPYHNMEGEEEEEYPPALEVEVHPKKNINILEKFNGLPKEKKIALVVGISLTALALFSIIYASVEKSRQPEEALTASCEAVKQDERLDAGLGMITTHKKCKALGACWDKGAVGNAPQCYHSSSQSRGYKVTNMTVSNWGMDINLERLPLQKIFSSEADVLKCMISYETDSRLRVKIYDPTEVQYEVPINENHKNKGHRMQYVLSVTEDLFGFSVSRTHDSTTNIINSTLGGLIYSDQFLQINIKLSSPAVYGLSGDHKDSLLRKMDYTYQSIWTTAIDKRYGAHPLLMNVEDDGHASGILLLNSNAMDVILTPYPAVTFRTTGGILDFYIFLGPTPHNVMEQFAEQAGTTFMPPLWALGYHFGSDNFRSSEDINITRLLNTAVPLDGIWLGRALLNDTRELTVDMDRYPDIDNIVTQLHAKDKHFMVDNCPGIRTSDKYPAFSTGKTSDIFVKKASKTGPLVGKTESGEVVFPDYFHPDTPAWLRTCMAEYRNNVQFDGIHLTDNEPSTVSDGSITGCTDSDLDTPIYVLKEIPHLQRNTLCPSALHYADEPHYNLHNVYGWKHACVTADVMQELVPDKRTLIVSRSTFIGSGVETGHWSRDNTASWEHMQHSIVEMLNYNLYGIPFVGANICGYEGTQDEELCVRWHQLAAFYPFALRFTKTEKLLLNFSDKGNERIHSAIKLRYSLLPTLYTQFYKAHTTGTPVVTPMFFDYLDDKTVLDMETQFMFAGNIMVAPVLGKGETEHVVYFPDDVWYDFRDKKIITTKGTKKENGSLDTQTYYVKGGSVVVRYQDAANDTKDLNVNGNYILDVYLKDHAACGDLFVDDGVSRDTIDKDEYLLVKFSATDNKVRSEVTLKYPGHDCSNKIQVINVRGLESAPNNVSVNNSPDDWGKFEYADGVLTITELNLPVDEAFNVQYNMT